MQKDAEEKNEASAEAFKEMIFAHAVANGNRDVFAKLYPEYLKSESDEEWQIPRTPEEIQRVLSEFHQIRPPINPAHA